MSQVHERLANPTAHVETLKQLFQETFGASEGPEQGKIIGILSENMINDTDEKDLIVFVTKLVVDGSEKIAGCIMFSRMKFDSQRESGAMLLGPVAVLPAHQKQGIGKGLIQFGLKALQEDKNEKFELAIVYGDPKYYSRVAKFVPVTCEVIPPPLKLSMPHGWQALSLTGKEEIQAIPGTSSCVTAMGKPEYW